MPTSKVNNFKNFEKDLKRLEEIVSKLENDECSLDDSIKLFKEGIKLSGDCRKTLLNAEQSINEVLSVDSDGEVSTQTFDAGDDD